MEKVLILNFPQKSQRKRFPTCFTVVVVIHATVNCLVALIFKQKGNIHHHNPHHPHGRNGVEVAMAMHMGSMGTAENRVSDYQT